MLARAIFFAALLSLTTALTSACSSGGGGGGPAGRIVPKAPGGYKPISCALDKVGSEALYANAGKIDRADSGYFGKRYNRADLQAVLKASIASTALYGSTIGAEISSVSFAAADDADDRKDDGDCYTYAFLPKASKELLDQWTKAAAGGEAMGGTLQGLYMNAGGPKVMILRGSDRWTLVHELMHYNFDKTRNDEHADTLGTILARIKRAQKAFDKHMSDFQSLPNRGDLQKAADDVDLMIRLLYQQNVDSFLEEIAIEAMLIDRYVDRDFTNVSPNSAKSAVWYILKSKENAMTDFGDYEKLLDRVEKLGNENFWPEIAESVKKDRDFMVAVNARIDEIIRIAQERVKVLDPNAPPPPADGEIETPALAQRMMEPYVMSARISAIVNSPAYRENKRGVNELVEKFGQAN